VTTTDTRTEAEKRYDAERSGELYTKPAVSQDDALTSLLHHVFGGEDDEGAIADWIDTSRGVLDAALGRQQALVAWKGETMINDEGEFRRYPPLDDVEIGRLNDDTPVYGDFDNDDRPLVVSVQWEGFNICAAEDGFDLIDDETEKEYYHISLDEWARLKRLVNSDAIDQVLYFGKAWDAQRQEPAA